MVNNIEIKEFMEANKRVFIIIFFIQLLTILLFYFDNDVFSFLLLKFFFLFINLFFIPGYLILKLIRFRASDSIDTLLFIFGTSIGFLIFLALIISTILHIFIPFSLNAINFFIFYETSILILILSILALYGFNKKEFLKNQNTALIFNSYSEALKKIRNFLPYLLLSWLMIFLSISGSKFGAFSDNTYYYVALDLLIIITIFYFSIKKPCTPSHYAIIIFGISLSLLFQHSLLSDFVVGQDIQSELSYTLDLVKNGFWDIAMKSQINSAGGGLLLASLFSILFRIDLQWTFKIIFPLIFAFVPISLFQVYKDIFNEKLAFLSVIFFISFFTFYDLMISLPRQILAEFFLCLILLLLIKYKRNFFFAPLLVLMILFSMMMILSHYVLAFMFSIIFPMIFILIRILPIFDNFYKLDPLLKKKLPNKNFFSQINKEYYFFSSIFIIFFVIFTIFWYFFLSSTSFTNAIKVFHTIYTDYFFSSSSPRITDFDIILRATNLSVFQNLKKYLNFLFILLAVPGFFYYVSKNIRYRKDIIYIALSIVFLFILFIIYFYPLISTTINIYRTIHLMLIITAPLSLFGLYNVLKILAGKITTNKIILSLSLYSIISFLCIILFILNIGLIYEFTDDPPSSYSLNISKRMNLDVFSQGELTGIKWSDAITDGGGYLIGDYSIIEAHIRMKKLDATNLNGFPFELTDIPEKSAIFLRKVNIINNKIYSRFGDKYLGDTDLIIIRKNLIYSNGDSKIYL